MCCITTTERMGPIHKDKSSKMLVIWKYSLFCWAGNGLGNADIRPNLGVKVEGN